ncbi:hypothetical protein [Neptunomonas japonica]|uniref:hypothetical protein n=1 Tax=Neptunomonas japonica TaxID=417574 RepID=UPI00048D06EB|nr:hypothetical protein [Neptunomonas japonica]
MESAIALNEGAFITHTLARIRKTLEKCVSEEIDKASLRHLTALHEIEQEDFIFLSKKSRAFLSELHDSCLMMCSMELALSGEEGHSEMTQSTILVYESAMSNIDQCLQSLYEELEFPSNEK